MIRAWWHAEILGKDADCWLHEAIPRCCSAYAVQIEPPWSVGFEV